MVKKTAVKEEVKLEKSIAEVMQENASLRATVEKLGAIPTTDANLTRYMDEMKKIKQKARTESDKIKVVEITDHKNISLWTKAGKRIGPLYRDNAIKTFQTFFDLGIILSTERPTSEQIELYKQTDEYKESMAKLAIIRKRKEKSRRAGEMQKLTEAIAKMSGSTAEAINHILKQHEIKPLAEGR